MALPQLPQKIRETGDVQGALGLLLWEGGDMQGIRHTSVAAGSQNIKGLDWPFNRHILLGCEDVGAERTSAGLLAIPAVARNLIKRKGTDRNVDLSY